LDDEGRVATVRHPANLPDVGADVARLVESEPFLLAVNIPLGVPGRTGRARPVDNLMRRRFGFKLPIGSRSGASADLPGLTGEALLAALAAAGHPCLPFPDRDQRRAGLAEIHPGLVLKALLWEDSVAARSAVHDAQAELFRAFDPPAYREATVRGKSSWAARASALDLVMRSLGTLDGFDLAPARELLSGVSSEADTGPAAAVFDATLAAGTARRYLRSPETCVFLGDPEKGYAILPADGFIRRLALREGPPKRGQLFPRASLRERLGNAADLRSVGLLDVPGRPQRLEADFKTAPRYEFDNVDEMLWWKHCRHLGGPSLPTEGLVELSVKLHPDGDDGGRTTLRLVRSRHRTLSFRFDPPSQWRNWLPTRDGKTYPFEVLRATYEALPERG
jgi:predicted RNase H-like nuclease